MKLLKFILVFTLIIVCSIRVDAKQMEINPCEDFESIYTDYDGNYYTQCDASLDTNKNVVFEYKGCNYIRVVKIQIDLSKENYEDDIKQYQLSENIIKDLNLAYHFYQENHIEDRIVTMFVQAASPTNEVTSYVYNGYNMRNTKIFYNGLTTTYKDIARGLTVINTISLAVKFTLSSYFQQKISWTNASSTLLALYCSNLSISPVNVVISTASDYATGKLHFNKVIQYTEWQDYAGNWETGLITYQITVTGTTNKVKLANYSTSEFTVYNNVTGTTKSSHFSNPSATALMYNSNTTAYERVSWKSTDSGTFVFF